MSETEDTIDQLILEGEAFADEELDEDALARFQAAWDMLPEPKDEQAQACQILAAIADSFFHLGEWSASHLALRNALQCGIAIDNPFIRLRMGQCLFELGDHQEACNWLVPVYLQEGTRPFEGEDPKYLALFRDRLEPPPGGWPEGW